MTVGYKRRKTLGLMFEGDMAGLDVTMRVCTVDVWMELCDLTEGGLPLIPENHEAFRRVQAIFVEHAESWSLVDDNDKPVPLSLKSLHAQDKDFQVDVVQTWISQMKWVPAPLDERSTGGPPVTSVPMDPPSASLAS